MKTILRNSVLASLLVLLGVPAYADGWWQIFGYAPNPEKGTPTR